MCKTKIYFLIALTLAACTAGCGGGGIGMDSANRGTSEATTTVSAPGLMPPAADKSFSNASTDSSAANKYATVSVEKL